MDKIRGRGWWRGVGHYHSTPKEKKMIRIFVVQGEKMHIFSIVNLLGNFMIWRDVSIQRTNFPSLPTEGRGRVLYVFPQRLKIATLPFAGFSQC